MRNELSFLKQYHQDIDVINAYCDEITRHDYSHKTEYDAAMDNIVSNCGVNIKQALKIPGNDLDLAKAKSKYFMYNKILLIGALIGIILYLIVLMYIYGNKDSITNYGTYAWGSSWIVLLTIVLLIPDIIRINRQYKTIVVIYIRLFLKEENQ